MPSAHGLKYSNEYFCNGHAHVADLKNLSKNIKPKRKQQQKKENANKIKTFKMQQDGATNENVSCKKRRTKDN